MPRFAGVDIPRNKVIGVSLTYIYGIGPTTAKNILAACEMCIRDSFSTFFRRISSSTCDGQFL